MFSAAIWSGCVCEWKKSGYEFLYFIILLQNSLAKYDVKEREMIEISVGVNWMLSENVIVCDM